LRYYEEIGLLPEASRTPAGYRLYDDHTLERLAFIARAKQLGCSLDEIADLTVAWDGGECGPVQDRLRSLVADKLAVAQHQIVDLMTLTSELQQAAAGLESPRRTVMTAAAASPTPPRQPVAGGAGPRATTPVASRQHVDARRMTSATTGHVERSPSTVDCATFGPATLLAERRAAVAGRSAASSSRSRPSTPCVARGPAPITEPHCSGSRQRQEARTLPSRIGVAAACAARADPGFLAAIGLGTAAGPRPAAALLGALRTRDRAPSSASTRGRMCPLGRSGRYRDVVRASTNVSVRTFTQPRWLLSTLLLADC
jgi:DNA-binding transcriptional MerR regulator